MAGFWTCPLSGILNTTAYYFMSPDDGHMTETCCGNNIRGGEEELFRTDH
jgi:pullulanase/glycogen debranching enzyme